MLQPSSWARTASPDQPTGFFPKLSLWVSQPKSCFFLWHGLFCAHAKQKSIPLLSFVCSPLQPGHCRMPAPHHAGSWCGGEKGCLRAPFHLVWARTGVRCLHLRLRVCSACAQWSMPVSSSMPALLARKQGSRWLWMVLRPCPFASQAAFLLCFQCASASCPQESYLRLYLALVLLCLLLRPRAGPDI